RPCPTSPPLFLPIIASMANYAYFSLWFRDFTIEKGIAHLEALLSLFPVSSARPGFQLVIRSLDAAQSSSLEADLLAAPAAVRKLAAQFLHEDTAYEVTTYWDLWQLRVPDVPSLEWQQAPSQVEFLLQGEEFDDARYRETGHVLMNLGFEHLYIDPAASLDFARDKGAAGRDVLGEAAPQDHTHRRYLRQNIRRIYAYARQVEKSLPLVRQRLWSEGEEDFARRTEQSLSTS
ncbi:MAG: hypothetical protein ACE5HL_10530, partial [Terriglobia bacterium]